MPGNDALNVPWDNQLRDITSHWFERAMEISGMSAARICREAGIDPSTIQRALRAGGRTVITGPTIEAIALVTKVPVPRLLDHTDYGALYAARHPSQGASSGGPHEELPPIRSAEEARDMGFVKKPRPVRTKKRK